MLFNAILSILIGFISFVILRKRKINSKRLFSSSLGIFLSVIIAIFCFSIWLPMISILVFEPMFKLQTYCESEPDDMIELGLPS
jgi:hypothetical protein